jgi:RNA-directed DNA polymerase
MIKIKKKTKIRNNFSDINNKEKLFELLSTTEAKFLNITNNISSQYYSFKRKKSNGKSRDITAPYDELKIMQKKIKIYLQSRITFPSFIHGGVKKRSQKSNAYRHVSQPFLFCTDLEEYYPSIIPEMVKKSLMDYGMNEQVSVLISSLCTVNGCLPQGAPTSTIIANLVFLPTNWRIFKYCRRYKINYSSFIDDLSGSSKSKLYQHFGTVKKYIEQAGFRLSKNKTEFRDKSEKQIVTKLGVNAKMRPPREYIQAISKDIRNLWNTGIGLETLAKLNNKTPTAMLKNIWGRISHVKRFDKKKGQRLRALMVKVEN